MASLYTPWMGRVGENIAGGIQNRRMGEQNRMFGDAFMGDPMAMQNLSQVNPQLAMQAEKQLAERKRQAQQAEMQKKAAEQEKRDQFVAEAQALAGAVGKFNNLGDAKRYAEPLLSDLVQRYPELAKQKGIDPILTEQDFQEAKTLAGGGAAKPLHSITKLLTDRDRTEPGSYKRRVIDRKLEMMTTPQAGTTFETTPGGVKFTQGGPVQEDGPAGISLHKGPAAKMQEEITEKKFSLGRVDRIAEAYDPKFLQYLDRFGLQVSDFREKMKGFPVIGKTPSAEDKKMMGQITVFHHLLRQEFNAYRKDITGAAAAFKELEWLLKSFINEKLSPSAFEAALGLYQSELRRGIGIKEDLLKRGIRFGTKEYTDAFDDAWWSERKTKQEQPTGGQTGGQGMTLPPGVTRINR